MFYFQLEQQVCTPIMEISGNFTATVTSICVALGPHSPLPISKKKIRWLDEKQAATSTLSMTSFKFKQTCQNIAL